MLPEQPFFHRRRTPRLCLTPTLSPPLRHAGQYATATGLKALDCGKDKHSPYAEALLLAHLRTPGRGRARDLRRGCASR